MATIYKDVVGQAELFEQRQAATERRAKHEAIVRLALEDVADADELRAIGKLLELTPRVVRLQIDPADDAGDPRVRVGERQEPARLLERLSRLDRDARVEPRAGHFAPALVGQ